ncbi:SubName: Full=Uncharacterized protein {ECO:0000313/EMBL:CCA71516.1} [Serendipita indica DSM 11827]|nr:SubName: Full=Uncharacterized protein {ECO:0000313/EMBL:CCA71516.1} [Serendipita indica DSM 11827]
MSYSRERITTRSDAPIINPYEQFTQPEFDDFIGGLTSKIRDALDPRARLRNRDRTAGSEGDFSHSACFTSIRLASDGSVPRSSEEVQEEEEEGEEEEDELDEEREPTPVKTPAPMVVVSGAGDEDSPFVISDDEEEDNVPAPIPQVASPKPASTLEQVEEYEDQEDEIGGDEEEEETDSVLLDGWNGAPEDNVQDVDDDEELQAGEGYDVEENADDATDQQDGEDTREGSHQLDEFFTADADHANFFMTDMPLMAEYVEHEVTHQPTPGILPSQFHIPILRPVDQLRPGRRSNEHEESQRVTWNLSPSTRQDTRLQEPDEEQAIGTQSTGIDDLISSTTPPLSFWFHDTVADPSLVSDNSSIATSIAAVAEQAQDAAVIHPVDSPPNELGDADRTLPAEVVQDLNRDVVDFPDPHRVPEPTLFGTPEGVSGISGHAVDPSLWAEAPTSNVSEQDASSTKEEETISPKSQSPDLPPAYMLIPPQIDTRESSNSQLGGHRDASEHQTASIPLETPQEELDLLGQVFCGKIATCLRLSMGTRSWKQLRLFEATIDADPVEPGPRIGESTLRSDDESSALTSDEEQPANARTRRKIAKGKRHAPMGSRELKALELDPLTLDMPRARRTRSTQPSPVVSSALPTSKGKRVETECIQSYHTHCGTKEDKAQPEESTYTVVYFKASSPALSHVASKAGEIEGSVDHDGQAKAHSSRVAHGDDEDYLPEEAERSIKKRKVAAQEQDLDHSLEVVDLGSVLEHAEADTAQKSLPNRKRERRNFEENLSVTSTTRSESEGSDFEPDAQRDEEENSSAEETVEDHAQLPDRSGEADSQATDQNPADSHPKRKHLPRGHRIPNDLRVYKPDGGESPDEYLPETEIAYLMDVRGIAEGSRNGKHKAKPLYDEKASQDAEGTHSITKPRKPRSKQSKKAKPAAPAEEVKPKAIDEAPVASPSLASDSAAPSTKTEPRQGSVATSSSMEVDAPPASKMQVKTTGLWSSLRNFWGAASAPTTQADAKGSGEDDSMDVD